MNQGSLLRGRGRTVEVDVRYLYLLQRNLVAEHIEIYWNVADGDTFFDTTRRQILRQFGDTL